MMNHRSEDSVRLLRTAPAQMHPTPWQFEGILENSEPDIQTQHIFITFPFLHDRAQPPSRTPHSYGPCHRASRRPTCSTRAASARLDGLW